MAGCQNNGGCSTGGCNKMNVFDWLSNMDLPAIDTFDVVEVRFKGGNKQFFRNPKDLELTTGDAVVVDVSNGHHIGYVSLQGELVRLQMQKKKVANDDSLRKVYRIATTADLESLESVKKREMPTLYRTRQIIQDLRLSMKLSDVEYQADGNKATFYYSADSRVDFSRVDQNAGGRVSHSGGDATDQSARGGGSAGRHRLLRTRAVLFHLAEQLSQRVHLRRPLPKTVAQPQ